MARLLTGIALFATTTTAIGCTERASSELETSIVDADQETVASNTGDLRIVTWNIHGSESGSDRTYIKKIAEELNEIYPDIAFLQEVHRGTKRAGGMDQVLELVNRTGMRACFHTTMAIGGGDYGTAVLVRGPVDEAESFPLPGRGEARVLSRCRTKLLDLTIDLSSVHLTAWGRLNRRDRRGQVAAMVEQAETWKRPILGGDFNTSSGSPEMQRLRESGLRPSITSNPVTHPGTRQSLDHIFVHSSWLIEETEVLERGPSDHWPVFLRVRPNMDDER